MDAVITAEIATASSILEKTKTLMTLSAWVRDFPELAYVWLYTNNMFADGWKLKMWQLTYAEQKQLNFKSIGALEATLTVNANEVVWYEAWVYSEEGTVATANTVANAVVEIDSRSINTFKVKDVVLVKPWLASSTPEVQATVTAVDTVNNEITLSTAVVTAVGDKIIFLYNLINYGTEITRWVSSGDVTPVKSYFQTFGDSVQFNSNELNQTRLMVDATNYVKERFAVAVNSCNNRFARVFYKGRNTSGAESETQGLDAVIAEKESREWTGSALINFSWITDSKAKALKLVEVINQASSAPVYNGNEVPTVYCNYQTITSLSRIKFDMANFFTLDQKEIEFGIQAYSSPFFKNVQFIVSNTLNKLEPNKSVMYMFPKHLVTFKTPQYQTVNEQGALITTKVGWYSVLKMPQTSVDLVKYTMQMRIANIFAGQSFKNTYLKIINL